jgi:hypothetical protein
MEVSSQLHTPASLPPWKELLVPIAKEVGGSHIWSGRCGAEKNILPLPGVEP